jgi:sigma-E factor negative regulatory protein RseC
MVEETGIVKSLDGIMAKVMVPKKSACEGCTAGICKPDNQSMEIEAINHAGAKVGQTVRIEIKAAAYMKGTMMVYGLPALFMVLGAVIGKEVLSRIFTETDPDILSAFFGFSLLIVSFIIVRLWSHAAGRKVESRPVIEEILS